MLRSSLLWLALAPVTLCPAAVVTQSTAPLSIDGSLAETFWQSIHTQQLTPSEAGVPAELGGDIRIALRGAELILAARCPEPRGKVLARSIGHNPVWERDSLGSPELEDRVEFSLRYKTAGGRERTLNVGINPWGAYRIEQDGIAAPAMSLQAAAVVTAEGWALEASIPLKLLDLDRTVGVSLRAERIRSRRALAPEFRWTWQDTLVLPAPGDVTAAAFRPPPLGNTEAPLEAGRVVRLPPMAAEWDDPAWHGVRSFSLPRNEPAPRAPTWPTEVRWLHDGRTLALMIRLTEPEPVVARGGGRDSALQQDDHVAIYLATSGSGFLEFIVNAVGAIRDSKAVGRSKFILNRLEPSWNAAVETRTGIRHGAWTARIDLPLQECAAALGEGSIPRQWRVLISRHRAARPGESAEVSALPPIGSATFYGPVRYRAMSLADSAPTAVGAPLISYPARPKEGLAGALAALDPRVWKPFYRRYRAVQSMVQKQQRRRIEQAIVSERSDWDKVKTREEWERFREPRLKALRDSAGQFPVERPPLDARVSSTYDGDGYRRENIVYQSRPGFYVPANLYTPARPSGRMPGMVIVHSQHYPKTQGELHDMGMIWGRAGCAVLVIDRLGFGERVETSPWYRQANASRFTFSRQLGLIGESLSGWAVWDLIRAVDFLMDRPGIDKDRIIMLGAVAGGGEPAAIAAALDSRIAAVIPFNYDQGHVRVHGDSRGLIGKQFTPWLVAASVAPRRFIRPFEFSWEGAEEPDYPDLWVDGWARSQKVWGFYGALDNLSASQGFGLIRLSMERVSHCWSVGPHQRREIYPTLNRWFQIPLPSQAELNMLPDSDLSTNPDKGAARLDEAKRRRPEEELRSITPALSAELRRKPLHQLAREIGLAQLQAARARASTMTAAQKRATLPKELAAVLGDTAPSRVVRAETVGTRTLPGAAVESVSIDVEDGISVPILLIRPPGAQRIPFVVGVAQAGKERFLTDRAKSIEKLIRSGVAVCLPDLRGTGETAPDFDRGDDSGYQGITDRELALGGNLAGGRLKDLRTVLAYLRSRADVDKDRLVLWGEAFAPANEPDLFLDELQWEAGPRIQYRAEPMGAHLALLAALYEDSVRGVVANGALSGYLSLLDDAFTYVPSDAMIPGILKVADIPDLVAALAPRSLTMGGFVTGRNAPLSPPELDRALAMAREAYKGLPQPAIRVDALADDAAATALIRFAGR